MIEKSFAFWPENLPRTLDYPTRPFDDHLARAAAGRPERSFIHFYGRDVSWGEADAAATRIAAFLQTGCGVSRGDRVLLYAQNCPQFVMAFHGILRAGGAVVPVNPMSVATEVAHIARDSGARIAFAADDLAANAAEAGVETIIAIAYRDFVTANPGMALPDSLRANNPQPAGAIRWADIMTTDAPFRDPATGPDDLAVLVYSSGTTGAPKGCAHTLASLTATAMFGALWEGMDETATMLAIAPLFHVTGMQLAMNRCIFAGARMALMQRWDARAAADLIERCRVTHWNGVPLMAAELLSNPDLASRDLSSIRVFSGGGAAMPAAVAQKLRDRFAADFIEGYGMTEAMGPTHMNPPARAKKQCLGIPLMDTESVVVDPQSLAVLPPGEVGEILVRGPGLFRGYWNNEQATRESFVEVDGRKWFRTGDLGRTDEDGYFFFADRLKRMINAAGYKVWPAEVESILFGHPDVQECCVIGAPDERRGETVKAVVVLKAGLTPGENIAQDIIDWSREKMAAYKVPRRIDFVDALPRGGSGKIDWRRLQEREFLSADT